MRGGHGPGVLDRAAFLAPGTIHKPGIGSTRARTPTVGPVSPAASSRFRNPHEHYFCNSPSRGRVVGKAPFGPSAFAAFKKGPTARKCNTRCWAPDRCPRLLSGGVEIPVHHFENDGAGLC